MTLVFNDLNLQNHIRLVSIWCYIWASHMIAKAILESRDTKTFTKGNKLWLVQRHFYIDPTTPLLLHTNHNVHVKKKKKSYELFSCTPTWNFVPWLVTTHNVTLAYEFDPFVKMYQYIDWPLFHRLIQSLT